MPEFRIMISNSRGLHARASAKFVETVEIYEAKCEVSNADMSVSGDSIMGLLMLAASKGSFINIKTWGKEENLLANAIKKLVKNNFHEES